MKRDWRRHLGPVAAVLWVAALVGFAVPALASTPLDITDGVRLTWPELVFVGAVGAFAGRVNARLDSIEKLLDKKQDKRKD